MLCCSTGYLGPLCVGSWVLVLCLICDVMLQHWLLGSTLCIWVLSGVDGDQQATHVTGGSSGLQTGATRGRLQVGRSQCLVNAEPTFSPCSHETSLIIHYFHKLSCNV